mmetsp:Transcript_1681/g.5907  ORF Transcript_1681/g.5907 Transcript_1681/m.5907 type:complete len:83 (-) Transcript_1681:2637-2885(-)
MEYDLNDDECRVILRIRMICSLASPIARLTIHSCQSAISAVMSVQMPQFHDSILPLQLLERASCTRVQGPMSIPIHALVASM